MTRYYYRHTIREFLAQSEGTILGELADANQFDLRQTQRDAWRAEINILKSELAGLEGVVVFEFSVPRMGSRIDVVLIVRNIVFVLEFKVATDTHEAAAIDQVYDYALDLHYFHEPSHSCVLAPILIATNAPPRYRAGGHAATQALVPPITVGAGELHLAIADLLAGCQSAAVDPDAWIAGRYNPTPTIVEAAVALYRKHTVQEISRSDAGGATLQRTSAAIANIIARSRSKLEKSICFITGVPGSGKTLVGLNVANQHTDKDADLYSVFLSGNGPLVDVLREALTRDSVAQAREAGNRITKKEAGVSVKQFIQNVHHFRDDCLISPLPPIEHVTLFDEAQRAWNRTQTERFMSQKKNLPDFGQSEPEFLISCLDRHPDWATVVCLVGGGQEINTGEGGIREWISALSHFPEWRIYTSPNLRDREFETGDALDSFEQSGRVTRDPELHLFASMRAFRAEAVSELVRALLEFEVEEARAAYASCSHLYPIVLTRQLSSAKAWLRAKARGSERFGVVVSSAAERLRPHAINVKAPMDPVHWFLDGKSDIRSSYYLEDVATEFHVQGLELDWTCVTWDADFRYAADGWRNFSFVGSKWNRVKSDDRRRYQKNAYRVLLTRARQGMIIVVPEGDPRDPTRAPEFYDPTFNYLRDIGFPVL
ncbi:MAG: DNA/RNA helicase domain-containing protein [Fimbriimonadaceae bacterium]